MTYINFGVSLLLLLAIVFYVSPSNASPVEDYINEQATEASAALYAAIRAFAVQFPKVVTVDIKQLKGKVWEIRVKDAGGAQHRILYAVLSGGRLALLVAFTKKTQKTPPAQIALAEKRLKQMTD